MQNDGSKLISGAAKPDLETWSIEEESAWTTKYEGMMGQFHIVIQRVGWIYLLGQCLDNGGLLQHIPVYGQRKSLQNGIHLPYSQAVFIKNTSRQKSWGVYY